MAEDKTIGGLDPNLSLTGAEKKAVERDGENFHQTLDQEKDFLQENLDFQENQTVTDFTDAFTVADGTNNNTLTNTGIATTFANPTTATSSNLRATGKPRGRSPDQAAH